MKTTITREEEDKIKIQMDDTSLEDVIVEFAIIFTGMVACVKDKFGEEAATIFIATAAMGGTEMLQKLKSDDCNGNISEYKEKK